MENLKYPIGPFDHENEIQDSEIEKLISQIEVIPSELRKIVASLSLEQLNTPYRPGGWQVGQVIHHLVDSHMNAYFRFNLALTENSPIIKPYKENLWAELPYKKYQNVPDSLNLLEGIHSLLALLMRSMKRQDFDKTFFHPENKRVYSLRKALALYAWHGKHHLAHINKLIERNFDR